jgi:lysophospholipase L1-like esterase
MKRARSATGKLILLLFGLSIGLIVAEACLRVLGVSYPLPYAPDHDCGTRLRAGFRGWWCKEGKAFIEINRYGFRHGDREPRKPNGTFRIAVLGDSFIEAFQVPEQETFCAVLERELNGCGAVGNQSVQVLNFGVSGYGTAQELLMLRHHVWQYEPDLVVLAFFAGNDLRNNSFDLEPYRVRPFYRLAGGELTVDNSFRQHPDFLRAHSASVRLKVAMINRSRILQLINQIRATWRLAGTRSVSSGVDAEALTEPRDDAWRAAWEISERLIVEIAREAERHEAAFLLAPVPEVAARCRRELQVDDLLYAERRLVEFARQHELAVVELAEPLRRYAEDHSKPLYGFPNTEPGFGHWNSEGQRLAGQLVARAICGLEDLSPEANDRLTAVTVRQKVPQDSEGH